MFRENNKEKIYIQKSSIDVIYHKKNGFTPSSLVLGRGFILNNSIMNFVLFFFNDKIRRSKKIEVWAKLVKISNSSYIHIWLQSWWKQFQFFFKRKLKCHFLRFKDLQICSVIYFCEKQEKHFIINFCQQRKRKRKKNLWQNQWIQSFRCLKGI